MSTPAKKGGLTLRRKEAFQDQTHSVALEARDWIFHTLNLPIENSTGPKKTQVEQFFASIDNGVLLCQLALKIQPTLSLSYKAEVKAESFQARDNIIKFIGACKTMGVPAVSLFEPDDLILRKNQLLVVNTLLYLARIGAKAGFAPPPIVQYEIEIEEANEAKAGASPTEEDDDAYEEPVSSPEPVVAAPAAAAAAPEKKDKPKKSVGFAGGDDDDEPVAAASTPAAEPVAAAAAPAAAATPAEPAAPPRKLYVPEAGNATDLAVAKVVNSRTYSVPVVRLAMKKGRKHDARNRGKGDYKIAGEKMFVRLVQGEVMVRHQGEWEELSGFLDDLEKEKSKK